MSRVTQQRKPKEHSKRVEVITSKSMERCGHGHGLGCATSSDAGRTRHCAEGRRRANTASCSKGWRPAPAHWADPAFGQRVATGRASSSSGNILIVWSLRTPPAASLPAGLCSLACGFPFSQAATVLLDTPSVAVSEKTRLGA